MTQFVYVQLADEGTDVWRPVEGSLLPDGNYLIGGVVPAGETWVFPPGSVVCCTRRRFADGDERLVAEALVR